MNLIVKNSPPQCLIDLESNAAFNYVNLEGECKETVVQKLDSEQDNICAYCDRKMKTIRIEHYIPQSANPNLDLTYSNLLGVCFGMFFFDRKNNKGIIYCEKQRGDKALYFNPLNPAHIQSLFFDSEGFVKSTDNRIQKNIDEILNLNFEELRIERLDTFEKETDNLVNFCLDFNITKQEGITRMLTMFMSVNHKRFLTEKFSQL